MTVTGLLKQVSAGLAVLGTSSCVVLGPVERGRCQLPGTWLAEEDCACLLQRGLAGVTLCWLRCTRDVPLRLRPPLFQQLVERFAPAAIGKVADLLLLWQDFPLPHDTAVEDVLRDGDVVCVDTQAQQPASRGSVAAAQQQQVRQETGPGGSGLYRTGVPCTCPGGRLHGPQRGERDPTTTSLL